MKECEWQLIDIADNSIVCCTTCGTEFSLFALQCVADEAHDVPNYCPHCGAKTVYKE